MLVTSVITSEQAMLELTLLNAESSEPSFDDVVVDGLARGIAPEILIRMRELWAVTKEIGSEVIQAGKIMVAKIIEFLRANPKLTGAFAIGGAVFFLSNAIPFIGPLLAPLLATATALFSFVTTASMDEAVETAANFFALLVAVFNAVGEHWTSSR